MALWQEAPAKEELEEKLACGATSLATIATVTAPWLREVVDADEFDYDLYKPLREPLRELRPVFTSLKDAYEAGEERREWQNLVEVYNRLRQADPYQAFFADWTPLQVLDDLARRYRVWGLEETPLWEQAAEELGLEGAVQRDADVLRVRAKLPHVGNQEDRLRKLLYSVHAEVVDPAAVFWEDDSEDVPQWAAMVLCPGKAALEVHFRKRRPVARLHRVSGGTVGDGLHLDRPRYLTFDWRGRLIHPADAEATFFRCAADLIPELPIAPDSIDRDDTRPGG
jgi:hypothetical protein